jgi:hypothetical protein
VSKQKLRELIEEHPECVAYQGAFMSSRGVNNSRKLKKLLKSDEHLKNPYFCSCGKNHNMKGMFGWSRIVYHWLCLQFRDGSRLMKCPECGRTKELEAFL